MNKKIKAIAKNLSPSGSVVICDGYLCASPKIIAKKHIISLEFATKLFINGGGNA